MLRNERKLGINGAVRCAGAAHDYFEQAARGNPADAALLISRHDT